MSDNIVMSPNLADHQDQRNVLFKQRHIDSCLHKVLKVCRDEHSHNEARELVPLSQLIQDNLEILDGDEAGYQDRLLPFVVDWFRNIFFSWFTAPTCELCSSQLEYKGSHLSADRKAVEDYCCVKAGCKYKYEFIRHNDPAILLRTRTGRCGEWAMCFFVILRALNYEARIVFDSTDHVWNEVWSGQRKQWVHVDSCEGTVDAPLVYEVGWGKKLEYCLAFSQYELLDVTKRYAIDYTETKKRRSLCNEDWLKVCLDSMTEDLLRGAPDEDTKMKVRSRRLIDIMRLTALGMKPQKIPDKSLFQGRKTGSVQWRIQRGEYSVTGKNHLVIEIRPNECRTEVEPIFDLSYNCDKNRYYSNDEQFQPHGWSSLVYEYENLDFKYERDWNTSYLSRYESCPASVVGLIRWRIDLSAIVDNWKHLELRVCGKLYPNTSLEISILCYETCDSDKLEEIPIELNSKILLKRESLNPNTKVLDLLARLSGGEEHDDVAWQKPQLFRQMRGKDDQEPALLFRVF